MEEVKTSKPCTKCLKTKPLDQYSIHKNFKDGHQNWCKDCFKDYREANREKQRAYTKVYFAKGGYGTRPTSPDPTYHGMHCRIKATNGSASNYTCVRCQGTAHDWSYNPGCAGEVVDPKTGFPYCYHVEHYEALCRSCHRAKDRAKSAI